MKQSFGKINNVKLLARLTPPPTEKKKKREDRWLVSGISSQFLKKHKLPQLNPCEINNSNNYITIKEIGFVYFKNSPKWNLQAQVVSLENATKCLKNYTNSVKSL